MKVLELFAGIGGFSLGLERAGMETVAFCEIDPFCQKVLKKHWPKVPIFSDIRELDADAIGHVDVITGGYPCQPFSAAGKRAGAEDDRHLWPEMYRIIKNVGPTWIIAENVAGHISLGLDQVLSDLESAGYAWWTFVIPACAVGAEHRRDRVWIVANADSEGLSGHVQGGLRGIQPQEAGAKGGEPGGVCAARWRTRDAQSGMDRTAYGVPGRVDRIRALGNAVVPQIPEIIGRAIMEIEA